MQIALGFASAKALLSATELGVFTELSEGALDLETITARLGIHRRSARDFMDTLVALGLVERERGLYSNTPETDRFLDRGKPTYIGGFLEMANARLYGHWGHLTEGLRTGKPQNEAKGAGFDALYRDDASLRQFLSAMTGISLITARSIAAKFPWADYRSFADIGCAQGAAPVQLALAHPHLEGAGFDLPVVRPVFQEYVESFDLTDRVRFVTGDFFKDSLPASDVLIMGHILHDWDLETKRFLLSKAHAALPRGRRADRLRSAHRRPAAQGHRAARQPEHAHRDARRVRLHRGRLQRLDARCRIPRDESRAPAGLRFDGHRHQVMRGLPAPLPEGMLYRPEFLSAEEEAALLTRVRELPFAEIHMHGVTARRRTAHFGWLYGYETWKISPGPPVPDFLLPARERLAALVEVAPEELAEALVTEYPPGAGIGWHRDAPMFGIVAAVSLGAPCRFRFQRGKSPERQVSEIDIEPRSAYALTGAARKEWQHGIPPAKALRYSITFRTVVTRKGTAGRP